jgi:hypothetical protein
MYHGPILEKREIVAWSLVRVGSFEKQAAEDDARQPSTSHRVKYIEIKERTSFSN